MTYALYLALGDSMSIDDYAGPGLGAASLLYRNHDARYPDFQGRDLVHHSPACRFDFRCRNGLDSQGLLKTMADLPTETGSVLVTITMGGNDLIGALRKPEVVGVKGLRERLGQALAQLSATYADLTVLQGNIYDPTDGTGILPSGADWFSPAFERLALYNDCIASVARAHGTTLIDIHSTFLGHAGEYYSFDIEPGVSGADALRRLWWQELA